MKTGVRPRPVGATAAALTAAMVAGLVADETGACVALVGGVPAGYVTPASAWRISAVMIAAFGIGRVARYLTWVLFDVEGRPPDEVLVLALIACAFAPGLGALLRRMSEHLERLR